MPIGCAQITAFFKVYIPITAIFSFKVYIQAATSSVCVVAQGSSPKIRSRRARPHFPVRMRTGKYGLARESSALYTCTAAGVRTSGCRIPPTPFLVCDNTYGLQDYGECTPGQCVYVHTYVLHTQVLCSGGVSGNPRNPPAYAPVQYCMYCSCYITV